MLRKLKFSPKQGNGDKVGPPSSQSGQMQIAVALPLILVLLLYDAGAQLVGQTCDLESEFSTLVPCLPYVQMQDEKPSQDCCSRVHSVLKDHFPCICTLVDEDNRSGGLVGTIINEINYTLARQLPAMCQVKGFDPASQCGASGAVGGSPVFANPQFSSSTPPSIAAAAWSAAAASLGLGLLLYKFKRMLRVLGRGSVAAAWRRSIARSSMGSAPDGKKGESFHFGPYEIDPREVFLTSKHSFALVNLKPVVPGHVLICSRRIVPRVKELSSEELCDLWVTAKLVGEKVEKHFKATSLTMAIQDGRDAGQTVPHVHVHLLPRRAKDFEKNDEIYDAIDAKEKEVSDHLNLDVERRDRSMEEMAAEAAELRALFG